MNWSNTVCNSPTGRSWRRTTATCPSADQPFSARVLLNQAVFQGVVRQVAVRFEPEFFQHARTICADRLGAEEHAVGDVSNGFTFGQSQENLQLAFTERFMRQFFAGA